MLQTRVRISRRDTPAISSAMATFSHRAVGQQLEVLEDHPDLAAQQRDLRGGQARVRCGPRR
jgi:hypothetical protein